MSTSLSPGQALVRVGLALVLVGAAATVVTLVPLFTDADPLPVAFYLTAMLAPVGLGLILLGLWRSSRARTQRRSPSTSE
jgi:hypothetical protein